MIADLLTRLGIPQAAAVAVIVAAFALVAGLLSAYFPGASWLPPVLAFLAALAAIIDPNAGHGQPVG